MHVLHLKIPMAAILLTLLIAGCDSRDERLVRLATDSARQQTEQNQHMAEMQKQVAEGARSLVAADAKSREAMIGLQRELQAERAEVGRQRDQLETDRKEIAAQRRMDPVIAEAISNVGLVLACLLPLVLCWYLLHRGSDSDVDQVVSELLIEDLVSPTPLLLPPRSQLRCLPVDPPSGPPGSAPPLET